MKTKAVALAVILVFLGRGAYSAPPEGGQPGPVRIASQPVRIVDFPTAGLLPRGGFRVETDVYADGGVLLAISVGFARYFTFGISYGGSNIIGSDDPVMNPEPAVAVKARIVEESIVLPAVAIGFDSQGYGEYLDDEDRYGEKRYLVKSRGVFAVASKNWDVLGPLSLHGGISYSLENEADNDLTVFVGVIKSFSDFLDIRAEYDVGANDNEGRWQIVEDRGYLNASLVWHVSENLSLGLEVRDIATKDRPPRWEEEGSEDAPEMTELEDLRDWNRGLSIVLHGFL